MKILVGVSSRWASLPFLVLAFTTMITIMNHHNLLVSAAGAGFGDEEGDEANDEDYTANLFVPPDEIQAFAPSQFPKPTHLITEDGPKGQDGKPLEVTVIVKPVFGEHRPDKDAVFAYAEGYGLEYYMMFIETLADTGFDGDYVLAISEPAMIKANVMEYLQYQNRVHVVIYNHDLSCLDINGEPGAKRRNMPSGGLDIFQYCQLAHVYGWKDEADSVLGTAHDPRAHRVVATLRYEWYWIWARMYHPNIWILLIDARDTIFQSNPFANLPRQAMGEIQQRGDGLLYFFGENHEATRLGKSRKNLNWLKNAYGEEVLNALKDKPTICSGSTMGEQIALETYLRALVNEWDETDIGMTGADQVCSTGYARCCFLVVVCLLVCLFSRCGTSHFALLWKQINHPHHINNQTTHTQRTGLSQLSLLFSKTSKCRNDPRNHCLGTRQGHCQQFGCPADQNP